MPGKKRTHGGGSGKPKKKGASIVRLVPKPKGYRVPDLLDRAFRGELTPGTLLLEAGMSLDFIAKKSGAALDIDAARVLDALWLARRRGDAASLRDWGRSAFTYLKTRQDDERWTVVPLPPQAGLDRSGLVGELLRVATAAVAWPPGYYDQYRTGTTTLQGQMLGTKAGTVGFIMASAVHRLFTSLAGKYEGTEAKIAESYAKLFAEAEGRGKFFDDNEKLAAAALRAFDVKAGDAWNWIKGVKVIDGGKAATPPKPDRSSPL